MKALVIGPKDKDHIIVTGRPGWISDPMNNLIGSVIEVTKVEEELGAYHGESWYWDKDWLKILND